jgi:hypothetical protein
MAFYDNYSNGFTIDPSGYQRTKGLMAQASDLIDAGYYAEAHKVLTDSGAIRPDLDLHVGRERIAKMRTWKRGG